MHLATMASLAAWDNYYVIVGSAAAGLTGLMFVAITLVAQSPSRGSERSVNAFSTPTIIHFVAAFTIAALLSIPWPTLWTVSVFLGLIGLGGIVYTAVILRRISSIEYQPVIEDWMWYGVAPLTSYSALIVAALLLMGHLTLVLFVVGGAPLLLLFTGIHNAWDIVTYVGIVMPLHPNTQPNETAPTPTARD